MITFRDSFWLARLKGRRQRLRHILSACSVAVGALPLLLALIATSGLVPATQHLFASPLDGRFLTMESFEPGRDTPSAAPGQAQEFSAEAYRRRYAGATFVEVAAAEELTESVFDLAGKEAARGEGAQRHRLLLSLTAVPERLLAERVAAGYALGPRPDGKVPVIVTLDYLLAAEGIAAGRFGGRADYVQQREVAGRYIGATFTLTKYLRREVGKRDLAPQGVPIPLEVIIVGVTTDSQFGYGLSVAPEALRANPILRELRQREALVVTAIAEYPDAASRDRVLAASREARVLQSDRDAFADGTRLVTRVALAIAGLLLSASLLIVASTIGRLVADSRKEIGVFRAMGAERRDIKRLFYTSGVLMATQGYAAALGIAYGVLLVLSLLFGDEIFYGLAAFSAATNLAEPRLLLVGFPWWQLGAAFGLAVVAALAAAAVPAQRAARLDPVKALREE